MRAGTASLNQTRYQVMRSLLTSLAKARYLHMRHPVSMEWPGSDCKRPLALNDGWQLRFKVVVEPVNADYWKG